jgi:hypothetical protein
MNRLFNKIRIYLFGYNKKEREEFRKFVGSDRWKELWDMTEINKHLNDILFILKRNEQQDILKKKLCKIKINDEEC